MANDFSTDVNCKAVWNVDNGALTVDSKGGNTLSSANVNQGGIFKQGDASAFYDSISDKMTITDANLDAGFPFKNGDANKKMSVCAWIRLTNSTGGARTIFSKGTPSSNLSIMFYVFDGVLYALIGYGDGTTFSQVFIWPPIGNNVWWHVAMTYDDSDKSYVFRAWDDNLSALHVGSGNVVNNIFVGSDLQGVGNHSGSNQGFAGYLDEIVVFNDILTTGEIDQIRNGTYTGPVDTTIPIFAHHYKMLRGA